MGEYLGYLKYEGQSVKDGYLDARRSADALYGFDEALRHFVVRENPKLERKEFELPVKVATGSWIAFIPANIDDWIKLAVGTSITSYTGAALIQIAQNDFQNVTTKDIFIKSLKALQWSIKIAKHLGRFAKKDIRHLKWKEDNSVVDIPNEYGEVLKNVPKVYLDAYLSCPEKLLSRVSSVIETDRKLAIGVKENGEIKEVTISSKEKEIFFNEGSDDEVLFPNFRQGMSVELEGKLTRGNERTNALGIEYEGHILTCRPKEGSIVVYREILFTRCKVIGIIDRTDDFGEFTEKKPRIIFSKIIPVESKVKQGALFNKGKY